MWLLYPLYASSIRMGSVLQQRINLNLQGEIWIIMELPFLQFYWRCKTLKSTVKFKFRNIYPHPINQDSIICLFSQRLLSFLLAKSLRSTPCGVHRKPLPSEDPILCYIPLSNLVQYYFNGK